MNAEFIGGPWAGQITMPSKGFVDGHCVEPQAILDGYGNVIIPSASYRFKNGNFHWIDSSKPPPPTKECPTCKGRGRVKA